MELEVFQGLALDQVQIIVLTKDPCTSILLISKRKKSKNPPFLNPRQSPSRYPLSMLNICPFILAPIYLCSLQVGRWEDKENDWSEDWSGGQNKLAGVSSDSWARLVTAGVRLIWPEWATIGQHRVRRRSDWLAQDHHTQPPNIDNFLLTTAITTLGLEISIKYIWSIFGGPGRDPLPNHPRTSGGWRGTAKKMRGEKSVQYLRKKVNSTSYKIHCILCFNVSPYLIL